MAVEQSPRLRCGSARWPSTDLLPAGMGVTPILIIPACGGNLFLIGNEILLTVGNLLPGASCSFSVQVSALGPGTYTNSVTVGSGQGTGNTATATLLVGAPVLSKSFGAPTIPLNGTTSLTFTVTNPSAGLTLTGVNFTDTLPAGLVVATPNNGLSGSCGGGIITAVAGSDTISLSGATLAGGASCTFSVNVTATAAGVQTNTTSTVGTSTSGVPAGPAAAASITVVGPPSIAKSFTPPEIGVNGISTLGFLITNPNTTVALTGVAFTDTLPAGLTVARPNGLTVLGGCGSPTITAVAGSNSISLSGATIADPPPNRPVSSRSVSPRAPAVPIPTRRAR